MTDIFRDIEMPLIPVLADMELAGIKVDGNYLKQLSQEFQERLDQKMDQIYAEAGQEFNINSPKQLGQLLFEELDLPKNLTRRTKTGYSTDIRVLQRLAPHHPLPELILEYRSFSKLKSTYTDALVGLINPDTGRIHTRSTKLASAQVVSAAAIQTYRTSLCEPLKDGRSAGHSSLAMMTMR